MHSGASFREVGGKGGHLKPWHVLVQLQSQTKNQPQCGLLSVSCVGKEAIYALDEVWGGLQYKTLSCIHFLSDFYIFA